MGHALMKRYFSFAFVRNPYTRVYSIYKYLSRAWKDRQIVSLSDFDKFQNFTDFVGSTYFQSQGYDRMMMPQSIWVARDNKSTDIAVDYVGNVERLESCLDEIRMIVGGGMERRKMDPPIPVLNKSSEREDAIWAELADNPALEETIYQRYELDFKQFGYPRWARSKNAKDTQLLVTGAERNCSLPVQQK
jgi:hypothetical protein